MSKKLTRAVSLATLGVAAVLGSTQSMAADHDLLDASQSIPPTQLSHLFIISAFTSTLWKLNNQLFLLNF